jgi:hypothetical protein
MYTNIAAFTILGNEFLSRVFNGIGHKKYYRVLYLHSFTEYKGADKSLARPTSRCILFDGENFSFDASLVIYIYITNIPAIVVINRIYETQNLLSL